MLTYTNVAASTGNQNVKYKTSTWPSSDIMKYVGICCATYQQKNYLCHWCPTVVSGSRRRLLPSRCPGFLLLLFGNSPATRAIIGVKFGQSSSFLLLTWTFFIRPRENKLLGWKTEAPPSRPLDWFLWHGNWSRCETFSFEIVGRRLLPYGREEQDEEEERMQRVEGVAHPG